MCPWRVGGMLLAGLALAVVACREPAQPVISVPTTAALAAVATPTPHAAHSTPSAGSVTRASPTAERRTRATATPAALTAGAPSEICRAERASRTPPHPECAVKGNVNDRGERIYHLPGMRFYDQTDINPRQGERWFRTAEEAEQAGWRRSRQ